MSHGATEATSSTTPRNRCRDEAPNGGPHCRRIESNCRGHLGRTTELTSLHPNPPSVRAYVRCAAGLAKRSCATGAARICVRGAPSKCDLTSPDSQPVVAGSAPAGGMLLPAEAKPSREFPGSAWVAVAVWHLQASIPEIPIVSRQARNRRIRDGQVPTSMPQPMGVPVPRCFSFRSDEDWCCTRSSGSTWSRCFDAWQSKRKVG